MIGTPPVELNEVSYGMRLVSGKLLYLEICPLHELQMFFFMWLVAFQENIAIKYNSDFMRFFPGSEILQYLLRDTGILFGKMMMCRN